MLKLLACLVLLVGSLSGQTAPAAPAGDPWSALKFLEGTWEAKSTQGASTSGAYTFARELDGHVMARHTTTDPGCKSPVGFDCKHTDLLYIYQDSPKDPLRAIYFDSEGHTLHYSISEPTPTSVIFLSEPGYGPQIRLTYELKASVMYGKFQMQMPGQTEWKSYLEWSGPKR